MGGLFSRNQEVIQKADINGKDISAISLTGHGNGVHLLDEDKKPVRRTIEGADSRGLPYLKESGRGRILRSGTSAEYADPLASIILCRHALAKR